jgi:D-3-phosphoglycerate dehydrogenase
LTRLLDPFEVHLLAVDPARDDEFAAAHRVEYMPLEEALARADIVALHLGGSPKAPLIGADQLARMKPGALLVNAARGGWVDEAALVEALRANRLGGAYLDVFSKEPYQGPLAELPNTVLTPHIGSYALECRIGMEVDAVRHVVEFFQQSEAK